MIGSPPVTQRVCPVRCPEPAPTSAAPTSAAPSPSQTTEAPTPSAPTTVDITALGLMGKSCEDARSEALGAGMETVTCAAGDAAPNAEAVNTVYSIEPQGNVPKTRELVLTYYQDQVPLTPPTAATLPDAVVAGSNAEVTWGGYQCPSGTGTVSSYNLTVTNGTFTVNGQSTAAFGPNDRSGEIAVSNAPGQTLIVTYTVTCTGGTGGDRVTDASPNAERAISPTPTPSATP